MRKHPNSIATKGDGLVAANNQPTKTLSHCTMNFIAFCKRLATPVAFLIQAATMLEVTHG